MLLSITFDEWCSLCLMINASTPLTNSCFIPPFILDEHPTCSMALDAHSISNKQKWLWMSKRWSDRHLTLLRFPKGILLRTQPDYGKTKTRTEYGTVYIQESAGSSTHPHGVVIQIQQDIPGSIHRFHGRHNEDCAWIPFTTFRDMCHDLYISFIGENALLTAGLVLLQFLMLCLLLEKYRRSGAVQERTQSCPTVHPAGPWNVGYP